MNASSLFTADDLAQFARLGVPVGQVEQQLEALRHPPSPAALARPCRPGDGIRLLTPADHDDLLARWARAAAAGRLSKFVPASGAATRMFAALRWWRSRPEIADLAVLRRAAAAEPLAAQALAAIEGWDRLPFEPTRPAVSATADRSARAAAFLDELGHGDAPKGLVPFHRTPDGPRTAFEEHLVEAAAYLRAGEQRTCRLHFSVAPEQLARFAAAYDGCRAGLEQRLDLRFDVAFSTQARATDTLALGADLAPLRQGDGSLLFQPSGHGALLRNLAALDGDLVLIKNIDNVVPEDRQGIVVLWQRLLMGMLSRLQEEVSRQQAALAAARGAEDPAVAGAAAFLAAELGVEPPLSVRTVGGQALTDWVRDRLQRPLRVCGMVPATGEPGGGPFWVRDGQGAVSPQIVEAAQVALHDAEQRAVWEAATHFNPVDLACGLLDAQGRPYDLERYVDPAAGFVTDKTWQGESIKTLERPGLWNGAMAGWNTLFVEIPAATFAPVKTVLDLLRPEHQTP